MTLAGGEHDLERDEIGQERENASQGDELSEGNEMDLVVAVHIAALRIEQNGAVEALLPLRLGNLLRLGGI